MGNVNLNKAVVQQQNIALTVYIPHKYLVHWYDLKQDKLGECSFVQLLNVFVSRHGIQINKDCTRINGILRRYCGKVKSKVNNLRGRSKSTVLTKGKNISVFQSEIASVSEANKALVMAQSVQQSLAQENKDLGNQLDKLTGELKELKELGFSQFRTCVYNPIFISKVLSTMFLHIVLLFYKRLLATALGGGRNT